MKVTLTSLILKGLIKMLIKCIYDLDEMLDFRIFRVMCKVKDTYVWCCRWISSCNLFAINSYNNFKIKIHI